jgi:hypothetical protein
MRQNMGRAPHANPAKLQPQLLAANFFTIRYEGVLVKTALAPALAGG